MYRPAVVAFIRAKRFSHEDAEDLGQQVFLRIIEKDLLEKAERSKGRFRGLVLGITKNIIREHQKRNWAAKRGGDVKVRSLSDPVGPNESQTLADLMAADWVDPDFDRVWVLNLVQRAMDRLRDSGKPHENRYYSVLECAASENGGYESIAVTLSISAEDVRSTLHRARERLRHLVHEAIRDYSSYRSEYETEIRHLSKYVPA